MIEEIVTIGRAPQSGIIRRCFVAIISHNPMKYDYSIHLILADPFLLMR